MDLTKRERIGLATFGVIILLIVSVMYFKGTPEDSVQVISDNAAATDTQQEQLPDENQGADNKAQQEAAQKITTIKVCILGEIKRPGVYTLCDGDRIEQAVSMAGGFTSQAQTGSINLALKLKDEDLIRIPNIKDKSLGEQQTAAAAAVIERPGAVAVGSADNQGTASTGIMKININTASKEQLKELPRIGDAIAQRILDYRQQQGNFSKIENIMNVSGIGAKMFENLKDKITVE